MSTETHSVRDAAESFGADAERYDRTRPRYPDALVARLVTTFPGRDLLDVGIGTGIAARQFRAAGCRVVGVDVDGRMAEFARRDGFEVEVSRFESWEPAGRTFDAVVGGQTWHWVDPAAGAAKAAEVLRPGGRLAVFWNAAQVRPELAEAFAAVHRPVMPGPLAEMWTRPVVEAYATMASRAADGMAAAESFDEPQQWSFEWEHTYTRDEWLDQLPTGGGYVRLTAAQLGAVLSGVRAAIDAAGGGVPVHYTTVAVTAARGRVPPRSGCVPERLLAALSTASPSTATPSSASRNACRGDDDDCVPRCRGQRLVLDVYSTSRRRRGCAGVPVVGVVRRTAASCRRR